jgi:hypothetical protein
MESCSCLLSAKNVQIGDRELPMVDDEAFRLQTEERGVGYADTTRIRTGRVGRKRTELRNVEKKGIRAEGVCMEEKGGRGQKRRI